MLTIASNLTCLSSTVCGQRNLPWPYCQIPYSRDSHPSYATGLEGSFTANTKPHSVRMYGGWWQPTSALLKNRERGFQNSLGTERWEMAWGVKLGTPVMACLAHPVLTVLSCWSYPMSSIARMLIIWMPFSSAGRQEYFLFTLIPVSSGALFRSSGRKSTP